MTNKYALFTVEKQRIFSFFPVSLSFLHNFLTVISAVLHNLDSDTLTAGDNSVILHADTRSKACCFGIKILGGKS
jgi:hypothetical protein